MLELWWGLCWLSRLLLAGWHFQNSNYKNPWSQKEFSSLGIFFNFLFCISMFSLYISFTSLVRFIYLYRQTDRQITHFKFRISQGNHCFWPTGSNSGFWSVLGLPEPFFRSVPVVMTYTEHILPSAKGHIEWKNKCLTGCFDRYLLSQFDSCEINLSQLSTTLHELKSVSTVKW